MYKRDITVTINWFEMKSYFEWNTVNIKYNGKRIEIIQYSIWFDSKSVYIFCQIYKRAANERERKKLKVEVFGKNKKIK